MSELVEYGFVDSQDIATTRVHIIRRDRDSLTEDEEALTNKDREQRRQDARYHARIDMSERRLRSHESPDE